MATLRLSGPDAAVCVTARLQPGLVRHDDLLAGVDDVTNDMRVQLVFHPNVAAWQSSVLT